MKRNFIRLLTFILIGGLLLTGCNSKKDSEGSKKLSIVTTIFPQYDFARAIVKDRADIKMLLKPGSEAHSYEPTPQDIKSIENSSLFIYVGGENDEWVDGILDSLTNKPSTLKLVEMVDVVNEEIVEGMEHEHGKEAGEKYDHDHKHEHDKDAKHQEAEHGEIDEHVWTSPKNAIKIVEKLAQEFGQKDPENKDFYNQNAKEYIKKLNELDQEFSDVINKAKRKTIVFGDRYPLRYFSDTYGLKYRAAFSGCSTDTEASAATVKYLIDKVKEEKIPVVFTIELSNGKIADSIVDATGAKKMTFYSCHNVTQEQLDKGVTYLDMMKENVNSIKEALN